MYALTAGFASRCRSVILVAISGMLPALGYASEAAVERGPDLVHSSVGYIALAVFVLAYALVVAEEFTHLRKSKPVIIAAGLICGLTQPDFE